MNYTKEQARRDLNPHKAARMAMDSVWKAMLAAAEKETGNDA